MRVCVFGAAGGTGKEVVKQALDQGHRVTAFVHDPGKLPMSDRNLQVVAGDARDAAAVEKAVEGHDAVVVAIGTSDRQDSTVRSRSTLNVVRAMEAHDVSRLVVVSAGGAGESYDQMPLIMKALIKTLLRNAYEDHEKQERYVRESDLDWVILRPTRLTEGPASGAWHISPSAADLPRGAISRADLAALILEQLGSDRYLGRAVAVT